MKEAYHFHSNPAAFDSALFNISIYFKSLFLPPQFSQVWTPPSWSWGCSRPLGWLRGGLKVEWHTTQRSKRTGHCHGAALVFQLCLECGDNKMQLMAVRTDNGWPSINLVWYILKWLNSQTSSKMNWQRLLQLILLRLIMLTVQYCTVLMPLSKIKATVCQKEKRQRESRRGSAERWGRAVYL